MRKEYLAAARSITLTYALLAAGWVFFTDTLLGLVIRDPTIITRLQTAKGWLFVIVSALAVYLLLRRELAARDRAERELQRVNRALRTLRTCNQVLIRATSEPELLERVCSGIVEVGGYRLAWVGCAEDDAERSVRPLAQAGYEAGYLETVRITWADTERGRGPTGRAIRSGQPVVVRDIHSEPAYRPWREEAARRGYAAAIALPITINRHVYGALNIYATEPDAFDDAELSLLNELVDDLAYGIEVLRMRAAHRAAEEQLQFQKTLLECQSEAAPDGILVVSPDRHWLLVNQRFLAMWNIPPELARHRSSEESLAAVLDQVVDPQHFMARIIELYANRDEVSYDEVLLKDGRCFERHSAPVRNAAGTHYGRVWYYRDITARKQVEEEVQLTAERLRLLSRRLVEVQENERRYLARELHDEIGQNLTGLHLAIERFMRSHLDRPDGLEPARGIVNALITQVRELSLDLRPAMLDDLGILPTLRWYFGRYTERSAVHVRFQHQGLDRRFDPAVETTVYRLVQEALTNVARHAHVVEVTVQLWADEVTLALTVEDEGCGFDGATVSLRQDSSGLAGMQERVQLLGGEFVIEAEIGVGTRVSAEIPLQHVESEE